MQNYRVNKFTLKIEYDANDLGCEIEPEDIFNAIAKQFSIVSLDVTKETKGE